MLWFPVHRIYNIETCMGRQMCSLAHPQLGDISLTPQSFSAHIFIPQNQYTSPQLSTNFFIITFIDYRLSDLY